MAAGMAPAPAKFRYDMKNLERWILQIDNYFTITETSDEQQELTYVGLYSEAKQ